MNNFENSLEILSNILQIKSYEILINDFNNNDLMQYLKHQDELLGKIITQNEQIIQLLKEGGSNGYRKNNTNNSG